jgi:type I restriction enzyme, S subunit
VLMNRFSVRGLALISQEQDDAMSGSRVQPDDVLLNITGASIGRVCVVPNEICPANVNQHVSIIRVDDSIEPQFLSFFLSSPSFQRSIIETQAGATRQALTKSMVESFAVPQPGRSTQRAVADRLVSQMETASAIDEALHRRQRVSQMVPSALLRMAFNGGL